MQEIGAHRATEAGRVHQDSNDAKPDSIQIERGLRPVLADRRGDSDDDSTPRQPAALHAQHLAEWDLAL